MGEEISPKIVPSVGIQAPPNIWFHGLSYIHTPNGTLISSAILVHLTVVINTHTQDIGNNGPHPMLCVAMHPDTGLTW